MKETLYLFCSESDLAYQEGRLASRPAVAAFPTLGCLVLTLSRKMGGAEGLNFSIKVHCDYWCIVIIQDVSSNVSDH